jgi:signal transduction histidine kinase
LKNTFYLFIILFYTACKDSKKELSYNIEPKDSLEYFINKSNKHINDNQKRYYYNKKAYLIISNKKNKFQNLENLLTVVKNFKALNKIDDFEIALELYYQTSLKYKDSLSLAKSYNIKANYFIDKNKLDSSYINFFKAEKIFLKLKDSINLGNNYLEKGFIQISAGDYAGCEQSSSLSLRYLGNRGLYYKEYYAYNYIGICSNFLENYENAILYHKKAYDIAKKNNFSGKFHYKSVSLNNIGVVYQQLNNHSEAVANFTLALKENNLIYDNPDLYVKLLDNLAYSNFKLKNYKKNPDLFLKSLKISKDLNLNPVISIYSHLAEYYLSTKDTLQSIKYSQIALSESKKQKAKGELLFSLQQLSKIDKKNSSEYSSEYIRINDSIQIAERKSKDRFARIELETDEIIQEKDQLEDKNRNLLYFLFGSVGLFMFLYYLRTQRAKNRELLYKQAQQKANEEIFNLMMSQQAIIDESRTEEKQKLARELHDGVLGRMFGLRLSLDSVNRKNDEEALLKRNQIIEELKTIEQDIREISHDLNREKQVLINNFVSIVNNLIEEQKEKHDVNVSFFLDNAIIWDKIASAVKINLYRILQESLQNINKYAKAKNINVGFVKNNDTIIFKISDDGIGFDANKKSKGIGTQNMVARTKECNGTIDILSEIGQGTTITITIPTT